MTPIERKITKIKTMNAIEKKVKVLKMFQNGKSNADVMKNGYSYKTVYTVRNGLNQMKNNPKRLENHYKSRLANGYTRY